MPQASSSIKINILNNTVSLLGFVYAYSRSLFDTEWRNSLPERLCRDISETNSKDNRCIWIHAASVGEVKGIAPLIDLIVKNSADHDILITTTSETGKKIASKLFPKSIVRFLPLEASKNFKKFINFYKPGLLLINETEIWPNMYYEACKANVPIIIVNGRISDKAFPKYLKYSFLFKPVLKMCTFISAQSQIDRDRFVKLGVSEDKIEVCGSTKYDTNIDDVSESEFVKVFNKLEINNCFVWTAGSVRIEEEDIILSVFSKISSNYPEVFLILAPRHPDRFSKVEKKLQDLNLPYIRRSDLSGDFVRTSNKARVILLDTIGELLSAYYVSDVSFVGGTLCPIGGHNILEPAYFSIPVLTGKYTMNNRPAVESLKKAKAYLEVSDEQDLYTKLKDLYKDPVYREKAGNQAGKAMEFAKGSTALNYEVIKEYLI